MARVVRPELFSSPEKGTVRVPQRVPGGWDEGVGEAAGRVVEQQGLGPRRPKPHPAVAPASLASAALTVLSRHLPTASPSASLRLFTGLKRGILVHSHPGILLIFKVFLIDQQKP